MVAVHDIMLSASGKADIPSSLLIIKLINSFCSRLHALPASTREFAGATDVAILKF